MDTARGFGEDRIDTDDEMADSGVGEHELALTGDERRMHVRAYNHWVSLLRGRAYPSIEDLDPGSIADFGQHSVLLDFTGGIENPAIRFLGRALREECALDASVTHIHQVPSRSLLSRLTDHYLQIIANRAPIGFEAEFLGTRGNATLYRGILMPFSSDADTIDFIYGVINWKELVDAETQKKLDAELAESRRTAPEPKATAPVWADGPGHEIAEEVDDHAIAADLVPANLADRLVLAQQTAAAVRAADTRSRAALYRALGRAHDFAEAASADASGYEELLADAGLTVQARAPLTPVAKLVFGADYDKTRLTEFAAVLSHARRNAVPTGGLGHFLEGFEGGIKAVVKAERALRRPIPVAAPAPEEMLADRAPIATVEIDTGAHEGELVVLVARAHGDALDIIASVANDAALTARAVRAVR
jgi:hypothetical protein